MSVHGFPPISAADAAILILGSMPGRASLEAAQYYAHPRNVFWRVIEEILDLPPDLAYDSRCAGLIQHRIALWDVLKTCTRRGSLDSGIDDSTIIPNDFDAFFGCHRDIRGVYFNGTKAEAMYHKYVWPHLREDAAAIPTLRLPSTSPANASMSFEDKLERWRHVDGIRSSDRP